MKALFLWWMALLVSGVSSHVLAVPMIAEGDCQVPSLAVNINTGKLEMDVTDCLTDGSIWKLEVDAVNKPGYYAPEEKANYAVAYLPFISDQQAHWEIRGQMPDARFASFQSYDNVGVNVDFLTDNDFQPDLGSVNWIQAKQRYPAANLLNYTVPVYEIANRDSIEAVEVDGRLYVARDSSDGSRQHAVVMRTYFNYKRNASSKPDDVTEFEWLKRGQVDLPRIFYVVDDASAPHFTSVEQARSNINPITTMRIIAAAMDATGKAMKEFLDTISPTTRLWQNPTEWVMNDLPTTTYGKMLTPEEEPLLGLLWQQVLKLFPETQAYPNEATRYFIGGVNQSFGEVHLTRFKLPTTPDPDKGDIIDDDDYDMRYFSVCLHNALTLFTVKCIDDSNLVADADGFVTVVTTNTKTAPIDPGTGRRANNWFEFTSPNNIFFIRHQWPNENFTQSLWHYGQTCDSQTSCSQASLDLQAIENWTGDYYPVSQYCSINNYQYNACAWTFNAFQEWLYEHFPQAFKRRYG